METIAVRSLNWEEAPQGEIIRGSFISGLIEGNVDEADGLLAINEIKVGKIEVLIQEGRVKGKASTTCILTDVKTGEEQIMGFCLT